MPAIRTTHVEVYLFRRGRRGVEFLALRRSPDRKVLPGVWQPVTGKREAREPAFACAIREVREETGITPRRWWALERLTTYFDVDSGAVVVLPLFAAELDVRARVRLSTEHDDYEFVDAVEAGRRFLWESQRRGLEAVQSEVLANPALARALEVGHDGPPRRPRARRGASKPKKRKSGG